MSFRYDGGDHDLLLSCYNHRIPEYHNHLLRATARMLNVVQVTVGNLLPSMTLFLLHHVEKSSAINHWTGEWLVSGVMQLGQIRQASVGKVCLVRLVHFMIFVAEQ